MNNWTVVKAFSQVLGQDITCYLLAPPGGAEINEERVNPITVVMVVICLLSQVLTCMSLSGG